MWSTARGALPTVAGVRAVVTVVRAFTAAALLLGSNLAQAADQHGLIVRMDGAAKDLEGPVRVTITGKADPAPVVAVLEDSGKAPDVVTGDGSWAGAASLVGNDFDVRVEIDGKDVGGGTVSWSDSDKFRELLVHWSDGNLSLEAANNDGSGGGTPSGPAPGGQPAGDPSAASGGGSPLPPVPGGAAGGPAPTVTFPSGGSEPSLYIGLGVGILVLVAIGWLWFRSRDPDETPLHQAGLAPLPEPSLLGGPTRSLSEGLSAWVSSDPGALLQGTLATLARRHRVLLVLSPDLMAPPVHGGPVFRASDARPKALAETIDALVYVPGPPLAVLVLDPSLDLQALADALPEGVGGVVLAGDGEELAVPSIRVTRDGAGWRFEGREAVLSCTVSEDGLHGGVVTVILGAEGAPAPSATPPPAAASAPATGSSSDGDAA